MSDQQIGYILWALIVVIVLVAGYLGVKMPRIPLPPPIETEVATEAPAAVLPVLPSLEVPEDVSGAGFR